MVGERKREQNGGRSFDSVEIVVMSSSGVRAMVVGYGCDEMKSLRYSPIFAYDEEPPEGWMWFLEPLDNLELVSGWWGVCCSEVVAEEVFRWCTVEGVGSSLRLCWMRVGEH